MDANGIRDLLMLGVHPRLAAIEKPLADELLERYRNEQMATSSAPAPDRRSNSRLASRLVPFLARVIADELQGLETMRVRHADFVRRSAGAQGPEELQYLILEYSRWMGASEADIELDRKAFARWFGTDAMADRFLRRHTERERRIAFSLDRLGSIAALQLESGGAAIGFRKLWLAMDVESCVKPLLAHDGDPRVAIAAFRCLTTALSALPPDEQEQATAETTRQYIYRSAMGHRQHVWIQCEALALLATASQASLGAVLAHRFERPAEGEDIFVRRRAVGVLFDGLQQRPELGELLPTVANDPSPYVRQAFAERLHRLPDEAGSDWLERMLRDDPSSQVRAMALLEIPKFLAAGRCIAAVQRGLSASLSNETDSFVLRTGLKIAVEGCLALKDTLLRQQWQAAVLPCIESLHTDAANLAVRRWAAQARERLWCELDDTARRLRETLADSVATQAPGTTTSLPKRLAREVDEATLGRTLAVMAQQDFGFDLRAGRSITRGHRFGLRLWRVWHEMRRPSPDKRQAFRHTIARIFTGQVRVPSGILAELAQTKVPGEPLFIGRESDWRPYLPLLDDVLSTLDVPGHCARLYSAEGVTEIRAPALWVGRLRARLILIREFAEIARLRNWQDDAAGHAAAYVRRLEELGFSIRFVAHGQPDAAVTRFFPAVAVLPFSETWLQIEDYFFSLYQNSLAELALFAGGTLVYFVGKHLYANYRIHRIRRSLPLVLGGWGTRGKSGTERIKAAMINAMGYSIVSKTTGCEAMFLMAHPFGKMREMFLFRPYDKATIWEQFDVMSHARDLHADVFLWECMALTPSYVRLLQRHWVRDDISTITNTFPDHEDLQGPAGINIPEVMTNFIPERSTLISSEEQMLPILSHAAAELHTELLPVTWLDSGLLTPDVLARFPYDEHPSNIALVVRLGQELGIEPDFALKEMADRVVPDLGVLKTYPAARVKGRHLIFVNGMSANERFGCLGNWVRMGFDRQDADQEPGVWISTVVNNRADRVARSQVFASILANDINADRHFLIGSNLHGLVGYISQAWDGFVSELTLWADGHDAAHALAMLESFARRFRVIHTPDQLTRRLLAMLQGLGLNVETPPPDEEPALRNWLTEVGAVDHLDDILAAHAANRKEFLAFQTLAARIASGEKPSVLDQAFRTQLGEWFHQRIVVIEDFHASGNQIVDIIRRATPPGYTNRVMGIQNIKGTGLDFVYRWQAWASCYQSCEKLKSSVTSVFDAGLRELASFQEFGVLCEEHVREAIEQARHASVAQREYAQAELLLIESNLRLALEEVYAGMQLVRTTGGWLPRVVEGIEAFLDAGDAVSRRKKANQIYRDLAAERISMDRAVLELQGLNKRQKGGWLLHQLHEMKAYIATPRAGG